MIPHAHMEMPPQRDDGFARLVSLVTKDGALSGEFPIQCEDHARQADHGGCKWPKDTRSWGRKWWDWLLEVMIYD